MTSTGNLIGGTTAAERNVISGNTQQGIYFDNVDNSTISGNYIGTNAAGTGDVNGTGVEHRRSPASIVINGSSGNVIGGTTAGARNVISGNNHYGFEVLGATSQNNLLQGNYIGTDATGLVALGNTNGGASFWGAGTGNVFGGGAAGAGNVISGNLGRGVLVGNGIDRRHDPGQLHRRRPPTASLRWATAATASASKAARPTRASAPTPTAATTPPSATSSRATRYGVYVTDSGTTGTVIAGNIIGLAADGSTIVANSSHGVCRRRPAPGPR